MCFSNNGQLRVQLFFMDHLNHCLLSHIFPPISLMSFYRTINGQQQQAELETSQERKTSASGAKFVRYVEYGWIKALLAIKCVFSSCFVFLLAASVSFAGFEVGWLRVERLRFKLFNTFNKFHSNQPTTNIHLNFNTLTFTVATACSGVTGTLPEPCMRWLTLSEWVIAHVRDFLGFSATPLLWTAK